MMGKRVRRNCIIILLLLVTFLIFLPPYDFAFVGDDYVQFDYVAELFSTPLAFWKLFNPFYLTWYYRPLQNVWFLWGHQFFGYTPFPFYFLQGLVHLLAVALVFRVGRQLGLRPFPAFLASVLFAIHGHWMDVVGWNSSIAIVMAGVWTLAAISAWLAYLKRPSIPHLLLTALFYLLTLLTHEETFLLPIVLLALYIWRSQITNAQAFIARLKNDRQPALFFTGTAVLTLAYLWTQLTRPNITIDITHKTAGSYLSLLRPLPISQFIADLLVRFTLTYEWETFFRDHSYVVAYFVLLLIALLWWKGGPITRIALVWTISHMAFIYVSLWANKPQLLAGRHIYNSWIGLSLAGGEWAATAITYGRSRQWRQHTITTRQVQAVLLIVVLALTAVHIHTTRQSQARWTANVTEDMMTKAQLQELMPEVTPKMHLFAARFSITPKFLRSVIQVWYDLPRLHWPYGPWEALEEAGKATSDYYFFDFDGKTVINIAPELQEADETIFIWSEGGTVETITENAATPLDNPPITFVAGEEENRRFAVHVPLPDSEKWQSLKYVTTVPNGAVLQFGLHITAEDVPANAKAAARVRLEDANGNEHILWQDTVTIGENGSAYWRDVDVEITPYFDQPVILRFEIMPETAVSGTAYWSDPRFSR